MVDRIVKNRILDVLRANNFRTAEQISRDQGLDIEIVKAALLELRAEGNLFYTEA